MSDDERKAFQSARPRGARLSANRGCNRLTCFNPRARVGRDPVLNHSFIHSPSFNPRARVGRDRLYIFKPGARHRFQSARPRGARRCVDGADVGGAPFQSARPRGARHPSATVLETSGRFNPRARVGRDRIPARPYLRPAVFQSARPRGARQKWCQT